MVLPKSPKGSSASDVPGRVPPATTSPSSHAAELTQLTSLLWTASRLDAIRKAGAAGYGEPRALIDAMSAAGAGETPALLAVRP
jgi:hypothetical protein